MCVCTVYILRSGVMQLSNNTLLWYLSIFGVYEFYLSCYISANFYFYSTFPN